MTYTAAMFQVKLLNKLTISIPGSQIISSNLIISRGFFTLQGSYCCSFSITKITTRKVKSISSIWWNRTVVISHIHHPGERIRSEVA